MFLKKFFHFFLPLREILESTNYFLLLTVILTGKAKVNTHLMPHLTACNKVYILMDLELNENNINPFPVFSLYQL